MKQNLSSPATKEDIENAVAQLSSAVIIALDKMNNKIDKVQVELQGEMKKGFSEIKSEIKDNKVEIIEVKRRVADLEADMPSDQTCKKHNLRITKLEKSVFASA